MRYPIPFKTKTMQIEFDFGILTKGKMKYDFTEPMGKHLDVKINGTLKAKNWIVGTGDAAKACEKLALRMALEVYIRSCIEAASSITIDSVVKILVGVGFSSEAIKEEARSGYFSVFFLFKPAETEG